MLVFVSGLQQLTEGLVQLSQSVENFCGNILPSLERVHGYISSLRDFSEEVRQTHQIRQALHDLSLAATKARQFLDQVCALTFLCTSQSDMMKNAQRGVNWHWNFWFFILYQPDYCPLNDLIKQLQQNMLRAGRCYEEFEEAAELAIRTCTTAAEECRHKEREVRRRKEATKVVGTD